jgi:hypothetical protein
MPLSLFVAPFLPMAWGGVEIRFSTLPEPDGSDAVRG